MVTMNWEENWEEKDFIEVLPKCVAIGRLVYIYFGALGVIYYARNGSDSIVVLGFVYYARDGSDSIIVLGFVYYARDGS